MGLSQLRLCGSYLFFSFLLRRRRRFLFFFPFSYLFSFPPQNTINGNDTIQSTKEQKHSALEHPIHVLINLKLICQLYDKTMKSQLQFPVFNSYTTTCKAKEKSSQSSTLHKTIHEVKPILQPWWLVARALLFYLLIPMPRMKCDPESQPLKRLQLLNPEACLYCYLFKYTQFLLGKVVSS